MYPDVSTGLRFFSLISLTITTDALFTGFVSI